ncbi:MAG: hypothetical protein M3546_04290 [Actinomycetota bacterium]|nr:hypothetical protein [Actinomycetota bacterium]
MELDPSPHVARLSQPVNVPTNCSTSTRAPDQPARSHTAILVTTIATLPAAGVATYGVATDWKTVSMIGLAATVLITAVTSISAGRSIGARNEILLANNELQQKNDDLRTSQLAVVRGFDLIDERTQGRLTELVEEVGDELAALADDAFDEPTGRAS